MTGRMANAPQEATDAAGGRPGNDRRERGERRRSARGLFELRARRDGVAADRRRSGSDVPAAWRRLLRRLKP